MTACAGGNLTPIIDPEQKVKDIVIGVRDVVDPVTGESEKSPMNYSEMSAFCMKQGHQFDGSGFTETTFMTPFINTWERQWVCLSNNFGTMTNLSGEPLTCKQQTGEGPKNGWLVRNPISISHEMACATSYHPFPAYVKECKNKAETITKNWGIKKVAAEPKPDLNGNWNCSIQGTRSDGRYIVVEHDHPPGVVNVYNTDWTLYHGYILHPSLSSFKEVRNLPPNENATCSSLKNLTLRQAEVQLDAGKISPDCFENLVTCKENNTETDTFKLVSPADIRSMTLEQLSTFLSGNSCYKIYLTKN